MYYIGIDLGGTNIACGLVNVEGKLLLKKSCKTGAQREAGEIMADMAALVEDVIRQSGIKKSEVAFCGIASPGIANSDTGVIEYSCNLPSFLNFNIVEDLKKRTGIPKVGLENDANCAAKGEAEAGAAKGCSTSVFITLGTGVGGGVIIDGKIFHGFNFAGAELGHCVIEKDGYPCSCGRRGCWETYSSATALCRMTREEMEKSSESLMWAECGGDLKEVDGRTAFDAWRKGDTAAQRVLDRFTSYLACGITNMVNIFQPEIISVGGGISAEGEALLAPVRAILEKEQYSRMCEKKTVLKKAELGNDAGIIGAALLWR
ncbi:MAG: ROK family protein [Clostridia bacterium]|nr:ROK family protein [Clostridia bacterium]